MICIRLAQNNIMQKELRYSLLKSETERAIPNYLLKQVPGWSKFIFLYSNKPMLMSNSRKNEIPTNWWMCPFQIYCIQFLYWSCNSPSSYFQEASSLPDAAKINLAEAWTEDYPVIFHIILWITVFMALLVIFATHGMMTMDPGNDSIIYRMTTTRLKKD